MTPRILMSPPDVGELEEKYLLEAVRSGWVAPAGPHLQAFERQLADRTGVPHAVALSSGTAALHLAMLGIGVQPGDVVLVPTITFIASANAVVYTGAAPCFLDVEASTGNIDTDIVEEAVTNLRREGHRVAAMIAVDLFGKCVDYDRVTSAARRLGVPVIEDAAEALGSTYDGRPAGAFGHAAALSFNGNKVMTTSGGGALLTKDRVLAERAHHLSTQARENVEHYEHKDVGFNYRMSNILAALGLAQLERLDDMIARRRSIRACYESILAGVPGVTFLGGAQNGEDNCWLTVLQIDDAVAGWAATDLARHLGQRGIETRPVWKPMHLQPVYRDHRAFLTGAAERIYANGLTLPSGSAHSDVTMQQVYDEVQDFVDSRVS